MLERASACLDSGVRLSLRAQRRAPKSRRLLHSSFWHHAAGDIDLPACLISSTCPPPLQQQPLQQQPLQPSSPRQHGHDATTSRNSTVTSLHDHAASRTHPATASHEPPSLPHNSTAFEPPLLDFLYPAQTLAFMSRVSASHLDRIWDRRAAHKASANGQRGYASMTASTHPFAQSEEPAEPIRADKQFVRSSAPSLLRPSEELTQLISTRPNGPTTDAESGRAWDLFVSLREDEQNVPATLHDLIVWLSKTTSAAPATHNYILTLFARLDADHRSADAYGGAVTAHVATGRIESALQLEKEARFIYPDDILGADSLLAYAVSSRDWSMALDVFRPFRHSSWKLSNNLCRPLAQLPDFDTHLFALARYYQDNNDQPPRADLLKLLEHIWLARVRFFVWSPEFQRRCHAGDQSRSSLRLLFQKVHKLKLESSLVYEGLITLLLRSWKNGSPDTFTSLIALSYDEYRASPAFHPSQRLLTLLIQFWRDHKLAYGANLKGFAFTNLAVYVEDMEKFHGRLDDDSFLTIMECMARQGYIDGVENYASKYKSLHPDGLDTSAKLWPLVYVHAKRADPRGAANRLSRIKEDFGIDPDLRAWNIVIHAYEEANDLKGAIDKFDEMLKTGLVPDAFTFGPVLNLYAKIGDVESTANLLAMSETHNIKPTVHMLNSLIVAHVNNDDMDRAVQCLEDTVKAVRSGEAVGSLTICFNTVMTAHALRRDIDATMVIYRRMKVEKIEMDANTYGALVQVLCFFRQSNAARKIIKTVMQNENVRPLAFHYAIVMAGYVNQGMFQQALDVAQDMATARVRPTASTRAVFMKAEALYEHSLKGGDLNYDDDFGRLPLEDAIRDFNRLCRPQIMAPPGINQPSPGSRDRSHNSVLEADFLVFIHGKRRAFEAAKAISSQYMSKQREATGVSTDMPPIRLITALMSVHFRARDYEEVDKYWELLMLQAEAVRRSYRETINAHPSDLKPSKDKPTTLPPVPQAHRFMLSRPLRYYLGSQFSQAHVIASTKMTELFSSLLSTGFQFDNRTWNALIVHLCRSSPPRAMLAYELVEKFLIDNWPGWISSRSGNISNSIVRPKRSALAEGVEYLRNKADVRYRAHGVLVPQYKTMVYLAGALLDLRNLEATGSTWEVIQSRLRNATRKEQQEVMGQVGTPSLIRQRAPRTLEATQSMPRVFDRLQQRIIRKDS